jgi:hypothetical protein
MPHYILDKAYTVNQAGGVAAHRVVVQGSGAGECKYPAAAGLAGGTVLGVTTHAQSENGRAVAVRKAGIALVEASGSITVGQPLEVAGTSGKVRAIAQASGERTWCVGYAETGASIDGDLIEVFLTIHAFTEPFAP